MYYPAATLDFASGIRHRTLEPNACRPGVVSPFSTLVAISKISMLSNCEEPAFLKRRGSHVQTHLFLFVSTEQGYNISGDICGLFARLD